MTDRIGSYDVFEIIGEGGMATVYRGRDPRFDRPVAVKVLDAKLARNPAVVERFRAEAIIQAKLNHPHVVTVLDFVAEPGTLAMVMEYVEGKPLSRVIEETRGPLAPGRAIHLMQHVLSAMEYAHGQGLVHRDLKPSNILIHQRGSDEFAKVMDFGIAKILGTDKPMTESKAKMGTVPYMSPEHLKSAKYVDARSDIYALGATLFEMLTGRVPFDSDSEFELMKKIDAEPPPDIKVLQPGLPVGLRDIVNRALAKNPMERFQSCKEFREALGRALSSPGQPALQQTAPASSQPFRVVHAPVPVPAPARAPESVVSDPAPPNVTGQLSNGPSGMAIGLGVAAVAIVVLMGGLWLSKSAEEKARLERAVAEERARAEQEARDRQAAEERARAEAAARERERAEQQRREAVAVEGARMQAEEAAAAQQAREEAARRERERQSADVWVDPSTNLMWAKRDNGSDVNWYQAKQYCESLTLGGYSDWRLPGVGQLEGLHDGSRGESGRNIKSPLTLTGWWAWSSETRDSSSAWDFTFLYGGRDWLLLANSSNGRALCVRGPGR